MEEFSIEQLSYCIVMVFGAIGGLFHVIQRSRCTNIERCGVKCKRTIDESIESDIEMARSPALDKVNI